MTAPPASATPPTPPTPPIPPIPPARAPGGPYRVCFVCTGNICRSPMAEVVLRELVDGADSTAGRMSDGIEISSAGTGPWHVDEPMDPRARAALARNGRADHGHIARQIAVAQLADLDLILALDRRHLHTLREMDTDDVLTGRLFLLGSFDTGRGELGRGPAPEIADPFYGEAADFEACLRDVEAACRGLLQALVTARSGGG